MAEQNPQSHESEQPEAGAKAPADAASETDAAEKTPEKTPEEAIEAADRAAEQIKQETGGDDDSDGDDANGSTATAGESAKAAEPAEATGAADGEPLNLENFTAAERTGNAQQAGLNLLDDIDLQVTVELGRTRMYIEDVLRLNENSVVELDKAAGDSVDIYVNERLVARGEVLVLNENFCVRINEIISQHALDEYEAAAAGEQNG